MLTAWPQLGHFLSNSPWAIVLLGATALGWLVLRSLWHAWQQAQRDGRDSALLRQQLSETTQTVVGLRHAVLEARAEAREQAAQARASSLAMQQEHMQILQKQVVDVASLTQQQLEAVRGAMQTRLQHLTGTLDEQLGSQGKVMLDVSGQLGALSQAATQLQALGKDISSLQNILRAPKLRGNLGEFFLGEILRQVLPAGAYALQHRLQGAEQGGLLVVDAVIFLGKRMVPIDAKFPLEAFQRLLENSDDAAERQKRRKLFLDVVKKHIDSIATKYIRPDRHTYDFALAYLPAENIYYEAMICESGGDVHDSVTAHAAQRKVIVVSPNTFYAYLLTVAYGLKGMRIEHQAERLCGELTGFEKKFSNFLKTLDKIGRYTELAQRSFVEVNQRGSKLAEQLSQMTGTLQAPLNAVPPSVEAASEVISVPYDNSATPSLGTSLS